MNPRAPGHGWTPIALGLGSNMGRREEHLAAAVAALGGLRGMRVERVSHWIETAPEGGPAGQGPYLNGALVGRTQLGARDLLGVLLAIEAARGRRRRGALCNAPRPLDLDLLLFGSELLCEDGLVVPHPRLCQRDFVLRPLAEIAADLRIPPEGHTVGEHLARLGSRARTDTPPAVHGLSPGETGVPLGFVGDR